MKRMFVYDVPIDGDEITTASGRIVSVNSVGGSRIQIAIETTDGENSSPQTVMAVGSGYGYGDEWSAVGTVITDRDYTYHVVAKYPEVRPFRYRSRNA